MYIQGLQSETKPVMVEWGTQYKHVPINIHEIEIFVNEQSQIGYLYDCVEKVSVPVTVDKIVQTALNSVFDKDFINYVQANIFNSEDERVKKYITFAQKINKDCQGIEFV